MFLFCSNLGKCPSWLGPSSRSHSTLAAGPPATGGARAVRLPSHLSAPPDAAVAVEADRRRGRGAQSNASGRLRAAGAGRFRRRLAELRGIAAVQDHGDDRFDAQDHHPQRFARYFLRSLDQSLPRLRAWLHLLLRAADPRLSRAFARSRFRIQAVRQARGAQSCSNASFASASYVPRTIAIGTNTDPYQPIEREHQVMRRILEVLERFGHPVGIVTKSALVVRDLDILARMAERNLVKVALSVTTLDPQACPRDGAAGGDAGAPARRAAAIERRRRAGVGHGRAGHSGAQRCRDRAHPRCRRGGRRAGRRAMCSCGCRSRCAICFASG